MTQDELDKRLAEAIMRLDVSEVRTVLDIGADPNCRAEGVVIKALAHKEYRTDPYVVELLFEPSMWVRETGEMRPEVEPILLALIESGVDPNCYARGTPLLNYTAGQGLDACVLSLLEHEADIEARDYFQSTALHWAVRSCRLETIKTLIERGADVNAGNEDGIPPLNSAAYHERQDIVDYLRSQGAKMGVWDSSQRRYKLV